MLGARVLLAYGGCTPVEDVQVGERVLAADPQTGKVGARPVAATSTGQGTKPLSR